MAAHATQRANVATSPGTPSSGARFGAAGPGRRRRPHGGARGGTRGRHRGRPAARRAAAGREPRPAGDRARWTTPPRASAGTARCYGPGNPVAPPLVATDTPDGRATGRVTLGKPHEGPPGARARRRGGHPARPHAGPGGARRRARRADRHAHGHLPAAGAARRPAAAHGQDGRRRRPADHRPGPAGRRGRPGDDARRGGRPVRVAAAGRAPDVVPPPGPTSAAGRPAPESGT